MSSLNRIEKKFSDLKKLNEKALISYVVAGYPNLKASYQVISSLVIGGTDILEIGIPFSDPIADGPLIQEASYAALLEGITTNDCLNLASDVRKKFPSIPLLVMTYSNIFLKKGFKKFMSESKKAGIDGFIIPDMMMEESEEYIRIAKELDLCTIFLISPNTPNNRIKEISKYSKGFIYVVAVYGTTGMRKKFENYTIETIKNIKKIIKNNNNIAVGFGISTPFHVKLMADAGADAVIVGSAIINIIKGEQYEKLGSKLEQYAKSMKQACKPKG